MGEDVASQCVLSEGEGGLRPAGYELETEELVGKAAKKKERKRCVVGFGAEYQPERVSFPCVVYGMIPATR